MILGTQPKRVTNCCQQHAFFHTVLFKSSYPEIYSKVELPTPFTVSSKYVYDDHKGTTDYRHSFDLSYDAPTDDETPYLFQVLFDFMLSCY